MSRRVNAAAGGFSCGCILAFIAFNISIGAWAFDGCLDMLWGKDIPWYGDAICGLFLAEIAIPVAIVCWIASTWEPTPFFAMLQDNFDPVASAYVQPFVEIASQFNSMIC